jgi:hypothetical protein
VVVVAGGKVVVGGDVVAEDAAPWFNVVDVVVGGGGAVVEVLWVEVAGAGVGVAAEDVLPPGCSFATATPMATVPPVANRMAKPVRRRSRAAARFLVSGELACRAELMCEAILSTSAQRGSSPESPQDEPFPRIRSETVSSIAWPSALTWAIDRSVCPDCEAGQLSPFAPYEGGLTPR